MAEALGIAASAIQVAGAGLKLADTLKAYTDSVRKAEKQLKPVADHVRLTSDVLTNVGFLLKNDEIRSLYTKDLLGSTDNALGGCRTAFENLDKFVTKLLKPNEVGKVSVQAKFTLFFKQRELDLLHAHLERFKSSLDLVLGVLNLASSARSARDGNAIAEMKLDIQRLIQAEHDARKKEASLSSTSSNTTLSMNQAPNFHSPETTPTNSSDRALQSVPAVNAMAFVGSATRELDPAPCTPSARSAPPRRPATPEETVIKYLKDCAEAAARLTVDIEKAIDKWHDAGEYEPRCLREAYQSAAEAMRSLKVFEKQSFKSDEPRALYGDRVGWASFLDENNNADEEAKMDQVIEEELGRGRRRRAGEPINPGDDSSYSDEERAAHNRITRKHSVGSSVTETTVPFPPPPEILEQLESHDPTSGMLALQASRFLSTRDEFVYPGAFQPPTEVYTLDGRRKPFVFDKDFLLQFQNVFTEKPCLDWDLRIQQIFGQTHRMGTPATRQYGVSKYRFERERDFPLPTYTRCDNQYVIESDYYVQPSPRPIIIRARAPSTPQPIMLREERRDPESIIIREQLREPQYETTEGRKVEVGEPHIHRKVSPPPIPARYTPEPQEEDSSYEWMPLPIERERKPYRAMESEFERRSYKTVKRYQVPEHPGIYARSPIKDAVNAYSVVEKPTGEANTLPDETQKLVARVTREVLARLDAQGVRESDQEHTAPVMDSLHLSEPWTTHSAISRCSGDSSVHPSADSIKEPQTIELEKLHSIGDGTANLVSDVNPLAASRRQRDGREINNINRVESINDRNAHSDTAVVDVSKEPGLDLFRNRSRYGITGDRLWHDAGNHDSAWSRYGRYLPSSPGSRSRSLERRGFGIRADEPSYRTHPPSPDARAHRRFSPSTTFEEIRSPTAVVHNWGAGRPEEGATVEEIIGENRGWDAADYWAVKRPVADEIDLLVERDANGSAAAKPMADVDELLRRWTTLAV